MAEIHALVVDNSPVIRKILSHVLEAEGCLVQVAEDGLDALDCIARQRPDIIFTDLIMPRIDGEKLCSIIRHTPEWRDIFLVVLSGVAMEDNDNTMRIGADICIAKGPETPMSVHVKTSLARFHAGQRHGTRIEGMEGLYPREVTSELLISKKHRDIILARMTEGVVEMNQEGRIVMANEAAIDLFGLPEPQVLGRSLIQLLPEWTGSEVALWLDRLDPAAAFAPLVFGYDNPVLFGERLVMINLVPVAEGTGFFLIGILQDVSRRKLLEQRQRQLEKELQRIQKLDAMSVMACGIAHDFNNLLTIISGNIEMARVVSKDVEVVNLLNESVKALDLTVQLIRQFTTFSDNYLPSKSQVSLRDLIEEVLARDLTDTAITFQITAQADGCAVTLDPDLVRQVFANLTKNAMDAINGVGHIEVAVEQVDGAQEAARTNQPLAAGDFVRVTFRDSGPGISPAIIGQVFDPYFSTKQKGAQKGMGLGLTIVHSIVKKHGGLVWIDAPPGQSCTVHLYFPQPEARFGDQRTARERSRGRRVLVMDDEELMRLIIRKMFEHFGCEVVQSATGEEALALCRQAADSGRPFDLVLLELWIDGGMGGIDAVGQIRELMPGAVIVAISGDEGNAVMLRADEHQFTTAQAKPFSIDAVENLILRFF